MDVRRRFITTDYSVKQKINNKMLKILVVSIAPWSRNNNFGKTFCDIFEGMEDVEFLNIYCDNGTPDNSVKARYFQIPFTDLLANLKNRHHPVGKVVAGRQDAVEFTPRQQGILRHIKAHPWRIFRWAQRFVWRIGRWRTPELKREIENFHADLLFLPIFKESYMNTVQQFVLDCCQKKAVAYYGDDNYSLRLFSLNPFFWLDRLTQRGGVKRTIDRCEYMYVVSDIEKKECERDFHKKCFICTKGADFSGDPAVKKNYPPAKKLVYTGNLGNHRWEELYHIGQALDRIGGGHRLFIYSGTSLPASTLKKLQRCQSIRFMGRVPASDIPAIQSDADILVHAESFRLQERLLVHQSFSTKIVDHYLRARCTFAVGAPDVASIDWLLKEDSAVVAASREQIEPQLRRLLSDDNLLAEYAVKGYECGRRNHDIHDIQAMLRRHFALYLGVRS